METLRSNDDEENEKYTVSKEKLKKFFKKFEQQQNLLEHANLLHNKMRNLSQATVLVQKQRDALLKVCEKQSESLVKIANKLATTYPNKNVTQIPHFDWKNTIGDNVEIMEIYNKSLDETVSNLLPTKQTSLVELGILKRDNASLKEELNDTLELVSSIEMKYKTQCSLYEKLEKEFQEYKVFQNIQMQQFRDDYENVRKENITLREQFKKTNQYRDKNVPIVKSSPQQSLTTKRLGPEGARLGPEGGRQDETKHCTNCSKLFSINNFEAHQNTCRK